MYSLKRFIIFTLLAVSLSAETVTFRSGNGSVGGSDSVITFLGGPANAGFGTAFTSSDFTNAQTGTAAAIISPNGAWGTFPIDPAALWIGPNSGAACCEGGSALFAIPFFLTDPIATATLTFNFKVDNLLGDSFNQGLFLNGISVGATTGGGFGGSGHFTFTKDITSSAGQNWLYVNMQDQSGPSAIIFSGSVDTTLPASTVPEPASMALAALGLSAVTFFRRSRQ
jgi:hypothetical protein